MFSKKIPKRMQLDISYCSKSMFIAVEMNTSRIKHDFLLRFYCVYNEEVKELIVTQETFLFLFRYDMESTIRTVESCASILTDIISFREYYLIPDPINQSREIPHSKATLYTALETLCCVLQQSDVCDHLKSNCYDGCQMYKLNGRYNYC